MKQNHHVIFEKKFNLEGQKQKLSRSSNNKNKNLQPQVFK
jgi:hypothetical protein